MTVVLITQDVGARGDDLAVGIASSLGLGLVGRAEMERRIAERTRVGADIVHRLLEGKASLAERWMTSSRHLLRVMTDEVGRLAAQGDVVVQCWRTSPHHCCIRHVICVHVCASPATSIMPLTVDRESRVPRLVLDTGRLPIDACIEQVRWLARSAEFRPTPVLCAALEHCEDPRSQLDRNAEWASVRLEVDVCGDRIPLPRAISSEEAIAHVERHLRRKRDAAASSYKPPHGMPVLF